MADIMETTASLNRVVRTLTPATALVLTLAMSTSAGDAVAQVRMGGLAGCGIGLPGADDRDSGLAGEYLSRREGQSFLFAPHVTVRGIYTDNVELAPEGEEEAEYIIGLLPGFSLCGVGNRVRGQLNYTAEGYYYTEDQDRNDVYHEVEGRGQAELVEDRLFVDATVLNEQRIVDSQRSFSGDNAIVSGNRADAFTYSVSPYWRQNLGRLGFGQVGYRHRRTMYGEPDDPEVGRVRDTYSNAYRATVVSPPGNDRWEWEFDYYDERVREQGIDRTEYFGATSVTLGYRVTGRLSLLGEAGLQHEYERDGTTDRFGSEFYNAGFRWEGPRTQVEARVGRQFFGTSYFASITRQSPRLESRLTYRETPQNRSRLDLSRGGARNIGDPVDDGTPREPDSGLTSLERNDIFVQRRLNASTTYTSGRSRINANVYVDDRESVRAGGQDEEGYGAGLSWRWQLQPRTSFIPSWQWERREFGDGQVDYTTRYQASLARLLSDTVQIGATVRHQWQNSTAAQNDYEENSILLEVTKIF